MHGSGWGKIIDFNRNMVRLSINVINRQCHLMNIVHFHSFYIIFCDLFYNSPQVGKMSVVSLGKPILRSFFLSTLIAFWSLYDPAPHASR